FDLGAPRVAEVPGEADVVRDLVEPGRLELRHDPFLQRCVDAEECVLDGVLGVFARAQVRVAVAVQLRSEALVQISCRSVGALVWTTGSGICAQSSVSSPWGRRKKYPVVTKCTPLLSAERLQNICNRTVLGPAVTGT